MDRPRLQITVAGLLLVVACVAINIWLFRVGILWGLLAVNVTKHVLIAYLCQVLGVDRRRGPAGPAPRQPRTVAAAPAITPLAGS
jgi:hypothetical protein